MQNGWPLREIRLEHATLEEFFVQVTANQAVGKATPAQPDRDVAPARRCPNATARAFPVNVKGGAE